MPQMRHNVLQLNGTTIEREITQYVSGRSDTYCVLSQIYVW